MTNAVPKAVPNAVPSQLNGFHFSVEVVAMHPQPSALAEASALVGAYITPYTRPLQLLRLNHILVQHDRNLGGFRCLFPRYRLSNGKSNIICLFSRDLERAIEDAVLARFQEWLVEQAERAKQAAQEHAAQRQEGGR